MEIPLVDETDIKSRNYDREKNKSTIVEKRKKLVKKEKPVRILRIKYYEKISLPLMEGEKLGHRYIYAVDRSLEDLLKALYLNTNIQGMTAPPDCIFIEEDNKIGSNNKFIFIDINKDEFIILKRQLENYTTIYALNKGEFSILEGKRSSLTEMYDIPRIWREK